MADSENATGRVDIFLGLGTNLGDRENNLRIAVERLSGSMDIRSISPVYETEPQGYEEQPLFLNAAVSAVTGMAPPDLLDTVKRIEKDMGRKPDFRNAPRIIDIDILFYGDSVIETARLVIPHHRIAERAFVLAPLADIAGDFVHPVLKKSIGELLSGVDGRDGVRKVDSPVFGNQTP